jgi:large subunit ribosomal protein L17
MRHKKSFSKLNRTTSHRKAMLANMATELLIHKRIKTTKQKARETRPMVERLITIAKKGTLSARRHVLQTVRNKKVVKELFDEIVPVFGSRNGGYTRIIKLGRRQGDGAEVAFLELVDFEGVRKDKKEKKKTDKGKKKTTDKAAEETEAPVEE